MCYLKTLPQICWNLQKVLVRESKDSKGVVSTPCVSLEVIISLVEWICALTQHKSPLVGGTSYLYHRKGFVHHYVQEKKVPLGLEFC
jgi:hypothetical protein